MKRVEELTPEQRAALAVASREARPNAEQRRQFAELKKAWRAANCQANAAGDSVHPGVPGDAQSCRRPS